MSRTRLVILLGGALAWADSRWVEFRSDGFQLFTNASSRQARDTLVTLEQFRHALSKTLARPEIKTGGAQVLLFRTAAEARPHATGSAIQPGRERVTLVLAADTPLGPRFFREYASWLIESNTDRMPPSIERGLLALFSTLEVKATRITLGHPPPAPDRDQDWARVHMFAVDADYYGKLPVMLNNLQKGIEEEPAYRNAFGKTRPEVDRRAAQYLAAGGFLTVPVSGRPIDPERDYPERSVEPDFLQKTLAGLARERALAAEYESLLASAQREPDGGQAIAALKKAAELQPKRAAPRLLLARRELDMPKRIELLKSAVSLDRRDAAAWQALAEAYQTAHQYADAAKAWLAAEQAATSDAQRAQLRTARLDIERQRLDFEEAERRRIAEEKERELRKLKEAAVAELRALEARVNKDQPPASPGEKPVPWWDGPNPEGKLRGLLKQVDCLGRQARLLIESEDGKVTTRLLIRDPGKIAIMGAQEQTLGCGKQKPRRIVVEYFPKPDSKLATAGDVATIEFP
ncbi:MAG: hypothetical protein HYR60_24460 [Acidobacteria bacterium]|nr:hypothetical protein [Acidobacteriota bacterium]